MKKTETDEPIKDLLVYSLSKRSMLLELFTIFGVPNTLTLISYFGGTEIKIPSKYDIQRQTEQIYMHHMYYKQGKTAYEIAKKFKISEPDVESWVTHVDSLKDELRKERNKALLQSNVSIEELENFIISLEDEDLEDFEEGGEKEQ